MKYSSCQWALLERFSRLGGQRARSWSNGGENCVNSPTGEPRLKGRVAKHTQTAVGRPSVPSTLRDRTYTSWYLRKICSDLRENFNTDQSLDKEVTLDPDLDRIYLAEVCAVRVHSFWVTPRACERSVSEAKNGAERAENRMEQSGDGAGVAENDGAWAKLDVFGVL